MEQLINQLIQVHRAMLENDEVLALRAQVIRKSFEELRKVGFTDAEAIQLVAAGGIGIANNS